MITFHFIFGLSVPSPHTRLYCHAQTHTICKTTYTLHLLGKESEKMPIISYASLARELSNKHIYKYFFRVVPSNTAEAEILKELILKYRFKEVSVLHSDEIASRETANHFAEAMKNNSVPVTLKEEFSQNSNADTLRKKLLQV